MNLRWGGFGLGSGGLKTLRIICGLGLLAFWVLKVPAKGGDFSDGLRSKASFSVWAAETEAVFESSGDSFSEPAVLFSESICLIGGPVGRGSREVPPRISVSVLLLSAGNFVRAP